MGKLEQGLQQKMLQKLSPQQIQLMKLFQVTTAGLEQRIKEEMEVNPALENSDEEGHEEVSDEQRENELDGNESETDTEEEEDEDEVVEKNDEDELITRDEKKEDEVKIDEPEIDLGDYLDDDDIAEYKTRGEKYSEDEERQGVPIPVTRSFHEYLEDQAGLLDVNEEELLLINYMIGSLDEDGYLRRPIDAMVDDLSFSQNIITSEKQLQHLLGLIQQLDPPGVGARDLQECLMLQLKRKKLHPEIDRLAIKVIDQHFDEFIKKHYDKLQKELALDDENFKQVIQEILHLNPKPGSAYEGGINPESFIIPDFFISNNEGKLDLTLNNLNIPDLRISESFKEMMKEYNKSNKKDKQQKEAVMFIKQKIDSAKWFIDAIRSRYNTMLFTMQSIMDYQKDFFLTGDETKLRPMILKDIADMTGFDISTISRIANSKYVQTEWGTLKLKSFFSESLSTDSGEEVSTREVKKILSDIVDFENKRKPLSDDKLCEMLNDKGYNIARRTVAKYREQLNIPVARLRREL